MKKAQVILEYGLVLSLVLAVFVAMQAYVKRAIQAQIKVSCDELDIGIEKQAESEEFDLKKGLILVSGQREEKASSEEGRPSLQRKEYAGGEVRIEIREKNEILELKDNPLPEDSYNPYFFDKDKRSGSLYSKDFQEEFESKKE